LLFERIHDKAPKHKILTEGGDPMKPLSIIAASFAGVAAVLGIIVLFMRHHRHNAPSSL